MELIIYRHAEPVVSADEIIPGRDFPLWVQRYNKSGILPVNISRPKEKVVYTSNLPRSIETGYAAGEKINVTSLLREAEIPLIRFPSLNLKAKKWLYAARILWLSGFDRNCESYSNAKKRAGQVVNMFKTLGRNERRIVAVGHGFINQLIAKELLRGGWTLKQSPDGNFFPGRMIFEIDY